MKLFVNSNSLTTEAYPPHDDSLTGDTSFTITLNYKWRKIIVGKLSQSWLNDGSPDSLDNDDLLSALLMDFYD